MIKKIVILIVVIILALSIFLGTKKEKTAEIKEVVLKEVVLGTLNKTIKADGLVEIKNEEKIYVSRSMRIDDVYFDEDDEVKKGDVLIRFDDEDRNNLIRQIKIKKIEIKNLNYNLSEYKFPVSDIEIKQKRSEIDEMNTLIKKYNNNKIIAKINQKNLAIELTNLNKEVLVKKKLYAIEGVSETELDEVLLSKNKLEQNISQKDWEIEEYDIDISEGKRKLTVLEEEINEINKNYNENLEKQKNNIEITKNQIENIKLEIESLEEDLNKTVETVTSPVTGTIINVNAEKNFKVNLEESLMTIADTSSQVITASISSSDIRYIQKGQKVFIYSDSLNSNEKIIGKVSKISSIAKTESGNGYEDIVIEIEITFDNKLNKLKPGYSVDVEVIIKTKNNTLIIPSFALQNEEKSYFVLIIDKNNIVKKINVKKGLSAGKTIEVFGLSKGDNVIMNALAVKVGDKVKVVDSIKSKVSKKSGKEGGQGGGR